MALPCKIQVMFMVLDSGHVYGTPYSTAHAEPAKSAATPRPVILVLDGIMRRIDESRGIDPRYLAYFRGINPPHTFAADRVQKYTPRSTCTFVYRRNLDLR